MPKASEMRIVGLLLVCATLFVVWRVLPNGTESVPYPHIVGNGLRAVPYSKGRQPPVEIKPVEWKNFTASRLKEAQERGKSVIIDFSAAW